MTLRGSRFLSLGALLLLAPSALAAGESGKGMAVARELVGREGRRVLVTVTPPADRAVDPRAFDMFEVEDQGETGVGLASLARTEKGAEPDNVEPLDLSDYSVRVEDVGASAATSCSLSVLFVRYQKAKLTANHYFKVTATGAASMVVSSFPTSGDVDAAVFRKSEINGTVCSRSTKGAGQFDLAKCNEGSCNAGGEVLVGTILNFLTSDAAFVGAMTVTFAQ
jgi:hypothetical protein